MTLNLDSIREQFPALSKNAIFLDNPGGSQIARRSIERINQYLVESNANHGGVFPTSIQSDAILQAAHEAMADFLNAAHAEETIFGANMTTLTLHISRSLARTWEKRDEIVVTRLDHDANVTPWVLAAQDRGCKVHFVDFNPEDGTLDMGGLSDALGRKPKMLAVGYASNALGTINPIRKIIQMAHREGCLVYVDAVQYAPHGPIDVQELDCDFLVCSAYKFFGPHVGILYGKKGLLGSLFPYKVRPASSELPDKFETGTLNHEGIAGVLGAIEYLADLGAAYGQVHSDILIEKGYSGRRLDLKKALMAIRAYEFDLSRAILETLKRIPGLTLYGLDDVRKVEMRVPTFSFRLEDIHPQRAAELLAKEHIYVWDGNYYALGITERLGVEEQGGMVRVGTAHYNTLEEISRLENVLMRIVRK